MKVHMIDGKKSFGEILYPLCGADLGHELRKGRFERHFITYPNQEHLVDCTECLKLLAIKHA